MTSNLFIKTHAAHLSRQGFPYNHLDYHITALSRRQTLNTSLENVLYAMDMSEMAGMSGMSGSGMDSAEDGIFRPTAEHYSHIFWYLVAGAIGVGLIGNVLQKEGEILRYTQKFLFGLVFHWMGLT